jgi:hypothetical protein
VLLTASEVDTLTALAERHGATLWPELRKAWMGQALGFAYADPAKRLPLPAHTYRLCLVVGVQPARGAAMLDDSDVGTPQRFLWLPATDPAAPDVAPVAPEPRWWWLDSGPSRVRVSVCAEAREAVDRARLERLRGQGDGDDGHALLARLKVGVALALLDGRVEVDAEDWQLAGQVLAVSDAIRAEVAEAVRAAHRQANQQRGEAEAARAVVVDQVKEDHNAQRVARAILRKLQEAGDWLARAKLRKAMNSRDRTYFDDALARLVDAGTVSVDLIPEPGAQEGTRYRAR